MVDSQAYVQHRLDRYDLLAALLNHLDPFLQLANSQYRRLGLVDDRSGYEAPADAVIGDGEGAALNLVAG